MKTLGTVLAITLVLLMMPPTAFAGSTVASGTITVWSDLGAGAEQYAFIAQGCTPDNKDGVAEAEINIAKYKGRKMKLEATGASLSVEELTGHSQNPAALDASIWSTCDLTSLVSPAGAGAGVTQGRPWIFIAEGTYIKIDSANDGHVSEGYRLSLI